LVKKVFLLIGLPGSGKSYWSKNYIANSNQSTVCVSLDNIREMLAVDYRLFPFTGSESKRWSSLMGSISETSIDLALKQGFNIIIDETHITKKSRQRTLNKVNLVNSVNNFGDIRYDLEFSYVWCTEDKNNLEYRMETPKNSSKETWEKVITNMKASFEMPTLEELKELNISHLYKVNRNGIEEVC
jgi:predicted kinase